MALFPRLNLRLLPMFKKAGEKKRVEGRRSDLTLSGSFWIQTLSRWASACRSALR